MYRVYATSQSISDDRLRCNLHRKLRKCDMNQPTSTMLTGNLTSTTHNSATSATTSADPVSHSGEDSGGRDGGDAGDGGDGGDGGDVDDASDGGDAGVISAVVCSVVVFLAMLVVIVNVIRSETRSESLCGVYKVINKQCINQVLICLQCVIIVQVKVCVTGE